MPGDFNSVRPARIRNGSLTRKAKADERSAKLSSEQLACIAQLIANGDFSLLEELRSEYRRAVLQRVATLRRERLVQFIAHEIAADIRRSRRR